MPFNTIEFADKCTTLMDSIYQESAITNGMDAATDPGFQGVKEVKVMTVDVDGLGDYDREDGYPKGPTKVGCDVYKLTEERGKQLEIDRMDNEETLGLAFGRVISEFMRLHVIPELDTYRFAKYASANGITKPAPAILTSTTLIDAIDEAVRKLDEDQVPMDGRILYISSDLKPVMNQALLRRWGSDATVNTVLDGYNNMKIKYVPATRFLTEIVMNSGKDAWGFKKAPTTQNINFMIIYPPSILQVVKFEKPKIFDPDINQEKDTWKYQYRQYHDALVYKRKANGVYLHAQPLPEP